MTVSGEIMLKVQVSRDNSRAEIIVPVDFPGNLLSPELCDATLRDANVEVTQDVVARIRAALASYVPGGEYRFVAAQETAVVHGRDGAIEWLLEDDPNRNPDANFYDRSAFVTVKPGQIVAKVIGVRPGVDGRDVRGGSIAAKLGREYPLKHDESLMLDSKGQLIAQADGVLERSAKVLRIRQMIEIDENVDFSTGNIEFTGSVVVRRDIRDKFIIRAGGNVEVHGMIEAATVDCGGDLIARGGMAGRNEGTATVGGNLVARYLDSVRTQVGGDLAVEREMINCEAVIGGAIRSPGGSIIGGRTVVTGEVEVATLGSGAGVATEIVLGTVPRLDPLADRLRTLVGRLNESKDALTAEQGRLNQDTRRLTSLDKERQTEILFELQRLATMTARGETTLSALNDHLDATRTVRVNVSRRLHRGTVLTYRGKSFKITQDMRGPIQIIAERGDVMYRRAEGEAATMLTQISDVHMAA